MIFTLGSRSLTKPCRLLASESVTLLVGAERMRFTIHKNLICGVVLFFQKAFHGGFHESITGEMSLPEEDPSAFKLFIFWLYKGKFTIPHQHLKGNSRTATRENITSSLRLYIMAEKWCSKEIQKAAIEVIYEWFGTSIDKDEMAAQVAALTKVVHDLYNGTTAGSEKARILVARQSMILAMRPNGDTKWLDRLLEEEESFALDFGKESWRLVQKQLNLHQAGINMEYFYT